jgi:type I restriction enzyme S subunit
MTLDEFFEKFELFADGPGAVAKMRELLLELAIQGKLVRQDDAEEPAAKQLERIAARKTRAGRVARERSGRSGPPAQAEAETPLPQGWARSTLTDLVTVLNGRAYAKDELLPEGTPVLRVGNLFTSKHWYYSNLQLESDKYCDEGDLIFAWSASFGPFIWTGPKAIYHYHIWKLDLHSVRDLDTRYLYWFLQNKTQEIRRAGHGVSMLHMTKEKMEQLEVMVPPLAEQKRIVAKVDELMALCDRLEAQQKERETRHTPLARASLSRFADAPTPANLTFLFHKSYTIPPADLRKSILTLAVQGKLVPQDPNDLSVEELFARIAEMRRKTNLKEYDPVSPDEAPYDLPLGWSWVRLGNISLSSDSGWSPQCLPESRSATEWGVLKVSAVSWGVFKPEENKALPKGMTGRPDCEVKPGDFLLSRANTEELVARSVVVDQTPPRLMMSDKIVRFTFSDDIERAFINLANASDSSRAYYVRNASGTSSSMKNIGREVMCNLPIPLPPLAEQRRIVAKVDQLMALVDKLETQIANSRATAAKLLDAIVGELTA